MNHTALTLLGLVVSVVAVWAECRTRNNSEDGYGEARYWRDSSQALASQLQVERQRAESSEALCRTLEDGIKQLQAWAEQHVKENPEETEEAPVELLGEPEGFLRSLWRLIW